MNSILLLKTLTSVAGAVAILAGLSAYGENIHPLLSLLLKLGLIAICIQLWFWTQQIISDRGFPDELIGDWVHDSTATYNSWLGRNPVAAKYLLISSSAVIDLMGLGLIGASLIGNSIEPFVALIVLFSLRQLSQSLCALPAPAGMIWFNPSFPSLLVTYETKNDFFFSGHTAIAVLSSFYAWLFLPGFLALIVTVLAVGEVMTVLVLRAHYTMDVMCAIFVATFSYSMAHFICTQLSI